MGGKNSSAAAATTMPDLPFEGANRGQYPLEGGGAAHPPSASSHLPPALTAAEEEDPDTAAFHIIASLYSEMRTAPHRHLLWGCAEALIQLVRRFPPVRHPAVWGIHAPRRRPNTVPPRLLQAEVGIDTCK
jgi:hypothetical protein